MRQASNAVPGSARVIVVGGGFAGLSAVQALDKKRFEVVLVDQHNYHLFKPLLYQVASAALEESAVAFPFRRLFTPKSGVSFRMARLLGVDADRKKIHTTAGEMAYDYLIIASGCVPNFFGNSALQADSIAMTELWDASKIRNRSLRHLEEAALPGVSPQRREALLTMVIVGGGASGVEIAGALADLRRFILPREYPEIEIEQVRIYLIEGGGRLLASMSERTSAACLDVLVQRGVKVRLGVTATGCDGETLQLSTGETIATANIIWTSGIRGEEIEGVVPDEKAPGRIPVDCFQRVAGRSDLFAIGDIALTTSKQYPRGYPQLARVAIAQGERVAANLNAYAAGSPMRPFVYRSVGVLATVGRNRAFAEWRGVRVSGFVAWLAWGLVHIFFLLGVENKMKVFGGWVWNYLGKAMPLQLITTVAPDTFCRQRTKPE